MKDITKILSKTKTNLKNMLAKKQLFCGIMSMKLLEVSLMFSEGELKCGQS